MDPPRPPWHGLLADPPAGAHIILWSDHSPSCDAAVETFLRGGIERGDLCVVVLPAPDLDSLRDRLRGGDLDLDRLEAAGRAVATTPEHLGLRGPRDVDRIPGIAGDLRQLARLCGRSGLTVLGRVAPPFFESGRQQTAEALEHALRDYAPDVRMLCAYQAGSVTPTRLQEAVTVIRCHTHAITALGGDQFFVEPVRHPVKA